MGGPICCLVAKCCTYSLMSFTSLDISSPYVTAQTLHNVGTVKLPAIFKFLIQGLS